ncbi:9670_t:CDS:2 [Acaulospora colombiana]|uniref:9670_t:CDS:1 n=1 Tax=Acaulospora colombiana TaxID=27376 RepID=A0ACA9L8H2_9GLOM|nr:9670_t:CDS:2 [Acaulospora colombiana]
MGYPVRGQRTKTNARTARKLNGKWLRKVEFSTLANPSGTTTQSPFVRSYGLPLLTPFRPFERFYNKFF